MGAAALPLAIGSVIGGGLSLLNRPKAPNLNLPGPTAAPALPAPTPPAPPPPTVKLPPPPVRTTAPEAAEARRETRRRGVTRSTARRNLLTGETGGSQSVQVKQLLGR